MNIVNVIRVSGIRRFGAIALMVLAVLTGTCAVGADAALATASVTNRDDKDHKITIIEGDKKQDFSLKPNQILENICPQTCVLRLNDSEDDEYQLEPTDVVSIEDGYLYYDNQEPEAEDPKKPEEPKKK